MRLTTFAHAGNLVKGILMSVPTYAKFIEPIGRYLAANPESAVGRSELQAFYGALVGQMAKRGVFITTSGFTAQGIDFARSVEGMVLVDGIR
jgi:hypothetical protein